ncbi:MAG TPA: GAF domain-containing protein, partial [Ktedonobacteraceae bacterium]
MKAKTNTTTREESAIVERVARIVSSVRGSKPDYTRLAAELEQAVPFDIFGVVLLRHDREAVRVAVCTREGEGWHAKYHQHPCAGSMLERVLQHPQLQVRGYASGLDGSPAESGDALSGNHQLRATVIAPLLIEDRVLGTLELGSMVPGTYEDETLQRLIKAVGHVLASAIESAQSSGSAEMQDRQRKALKDVSSALTSEVELATILNQIVEGIAKALQVASAVVTVNRRENRLCLEAQCGLDGPRAQAIFQEGWPLIGTCIIGESLLQQRVRISQDISIDERYPGCQQNFRDLQMYSICSYPLVTGNVVYGALLLCSPEPGGFTPLKIDILSLFASQATVAIHNCMLLEAAQQRSRFQEAIGRLEQVHQRKTSGALQWGSATEAIEATEEDTLQAEYEMVKYIHEESQRIFGVSFSSLLRFISNHLLTQHERDLHIILQSDQEEQEVQVRGSVGESLEPEQETEEAQFGATRKDALAHTVALLSQTAEAALLSTDMLGELSRLLLQLQNTTANGVKDAWFVVDMQGKCVYMNPMAETLCDVRLENMALVYETPLLSSTSRKEHTAKIENIFARLLPRIRNAEEIRQYLQEFGKGMPYQQELQCVVADEPLSEKYSMPAMTERIRGRKESTAADYHYQLRRYPLYNQQGQCIAHALQVHDQTEQVRDEKNRSALLSAVSHDLRTPLTTIKVAVTGLLQEEVQWEEDDRREILQDIENETD